MKNEKIKFKHVKQTQERLYKFYLLVITNGCVKIVVLEICFEEQTKESVARIFKNIFTIAVHC